MVIFLVLAFISVILLEAPGLIREKMWKELAVFLSLLLIGAYYSFGQVFDWPLPNPTKVVEAVFGPVGDLIDKLLS